MIEQLTPFQKDRVDICMRVDESFGRLNTKLTILRSGNPHIEGFVESTQQTVDYGSTRSIISRDLHINPRFLFGMWLIRKFLEADILENREIPQEVPKEAA